MKSLKIVFLVLSLFVPLLPGIPGYAWEWMPEFQSLTEPEQAAFESPDRFDAEYSSDTLSYLKSFRWEYEWLASRNAYELGFGSVSAMHFDLSNRLKIRHDLNDSVEFRFTFVDERSLERQATHHLIELIYWAELLKLGGAGRVGFSFYGEPSMAKREDDTGLALIYQSSPRHEIRFFNTFVDVTRMRRSDNNDTFIKPYLPASRGIMGRVWSDPDSGKQEFLEYSIRYETKTRWLLRNSETLYDYWKGFASIFGRKRLSDSLYLQHRTQFDRKFEHSAPSTETALVTDTACRTDRLLSLTQLEIGGIGPRGDWLLTPGFELTNRYWGTNSGEVLFRDLLPNIQLELPGGGSGKTQDRWTIGYVGNWHRSFGNPWLMSPLNDPNVFEQKLNISYDFRFSAAELVLMVTGDLDKMFTRKSWDGGAGMFRMSF